eukprot:TRINITY_DN119_c0_g1_i1.p1 TRINITY_DN119_c0_g1~~TRINITY_DN119_c0_g1_i1.p1  ORF type:complete len:975 (-),score=71.83 TRINITY_DN119_c0_g1_i1:8854-11778(-)
MDTQRELVRKLYMAASHNDVFALDQELQALPKDKARKILSETMFEALDKSVSSADFHAVAEILLSRGADLNSPSSSEAILILKVLYKKMWQVAEWLLTRNPDLNLKDQSKKSCLHVILESASNDPKLAFLLSKFLAQGAKPNEEDLEGNTPLHKACEKLWVDAIRILVNYKANANHRNSITFDMPLHIVSRIKSPHAIDCANELIAAGGIVKVESRAGKTPLEEAASVGNTELQGFLHTKMMEQEYFAQQSYMAGAYGVPSMSTVPQMYGGMHPQLYIQPQGYPVNGMSYEQPYYSCSFPSMKQFIDRPEYVPRGKRPFRPYKDKWSYFPPPASTGFGLPYAPSMVPPYSDPMGFQNAPYVRPRFPTYASNYFPQPPQPAYVHNKPESQPVGEAGKTSSGSIPVLVLDISNSKAQQDLLDSVKEEKEEDEFRKDFPYLLEESKRLDENTLLLKSQYDAKIQEANKQLEELKLVLRERETLLRKRDIERNIIHEQISKNLGLLKEFAHKKHIKEVEESKGTEDSVEGYIKALGYKYAVNDLPKDYVYDKLTSDIAEFCKLVKLETVAMKSVRERLISEIRSQVRMLNSYLEISIYGSYAVDLSLPTSDIDIIIVQAQGISKANSAAILENLCEVLKRQKYVRETKMIQNTSMPVLRVECNEEMNCAKLDITVNDSRHKGIECVEMVRNVLKEYPELEKLMLVLKHILKIAELNDPYLGGLSSYGLFLLLLAYMEWHQENKHEKNTGKLLLRILRFYAMFDFRNTSVYSQYPMYDIAQRESIFVQSMSDLPVVVDPLVKSTKNNVTKSTINMDQIKKMFKVAASSVYHDCTCCAHRKDLREYQKYAETKVRFLDKGHSLLANLFASVTPFSFQSYKQAHFGNDSQHCSFRVISSNEIKVQQFMNNIMVRNITQYCPKYHYQNAKATLRTFVCSTLCLCSNYQGCGLLNPRLLCSTLLGGQWICFCYTSWVLQLWCC